MANSTRVSALWQTSVWQKTVKHSCLALASFVLISGCGGGYDGGGSEPELPPVATVAPVPLPAPTLAPTPAPIVRSENPRQLENLDRGLVVIPAGKGNAISWRLLGSDNPAISFDVYRNGAKLNETALTHKTFFRDEDGQSTDSYQVRGIIDGAEVSVSESLSPWAAPFHSIPLNRPMDGFIQGERYSYQANDASVADLDGDGQYEVVLKWMPVNPDSRNGGAKDNAQAGITGNVFIDAYTLAGEQLWRIDLGRNIRAGAHYNPFMVYDFDGDGRAEMAVKTADGTVDGRGVVIGDPDADYRNDDGYILEGPEFLTMFDGLSGEALDTVDYLPPRGVVGDWGDEYGNRVDRFLGGVAYLNGETPSLIMSRGVYTRVVVAAYDWADGVLSSRWVFDTDNGGDDAAMFGQGNHSLSIADVDNDGLDEIVYGSGVIDDNGSILYSIGLCDGDALHVGDFNLDNAGLEVFVPHETPGCYVDADGVDRGVEMHSAATGEFVWSLPGDGADVGRGMTADIDPRFPGNESWASRGSLRSSIGEDLGADKPTQTNFAAWWDGDLLREMLDHTTISKWNYIGAEDFPILETAEYNAVSNNGTKATPSLSADVFGDWREEVMFANSASTSLMIFTTPHDTDTRMHTLMHDAQYRVAIAWQNAGYNQPPHPSFHIGSAMQELRWEADIAPVEGGEWAKLVAQGNGESVVVRAYINGFDVSGIDIYRDTDEDPEGRTLITSLSDQRHYVDEDVVPDVRYYYWAELTDSTASTAVDLGRSRTQLTTSLLPSFWVAAVQSEGAHGAVKLLWNTQNIDVAAINIYRVGALSEDDAPNTEGRAIVATPGPSATEWTDTSSVPGASYFYWVEFIDETAGVNHMSSPTFGENIIPPTTNLTSAIDETSIVLSYDLQNFDEIASIEMYRNTRNQLGGRVRVMTSDVNLSGTFVDDGTAPNAALVSGATYWYMFKIAMADGSTVNTDPEAMIEYTPTLPLTNLTSVVEGSTVALSYNLQDFPAIRSVEIYRNTRPETDGRARVRTGDANLSGTFVDDGSIHPLEEDQTYWYMFKITLEDDSVVNTAPEAQVVYYPGGPTANFVSAVDGSSIVLTYDLKGFLPITSFEIYRNTKNEINGRERIRTGDSALSGSFVDDGSNVGTPPVSGTTYWYMLKVIMADGSTFNTNPEASIAFP